MSSAQEYGDNAWKLRSCSIAILVGFLSSSCLGSPVREIRVWVSIRVHVWFATKFVSGFVSVQCRVRVWCVSDSCLVRVGFVWFVSGFLSGSCSVHVWFVSGARLVLVCIYIQFLLGRIWFIVGYVKKILLFRIWSFIYEIYKILE